MTKKKQVVGKKQEVKPRFTATTIVAPVDGRDYPEPSPEIGKQDPVSLVSDLDKELSYMQESLQILKDGNAKLREAVNKLTTFTVPEIDKIV